uniref:Uncharacterized protein n=1 Tax=Kalanchoe fedtschenkoi TaxID=63787 RepID=A0A7N0ULT3_KALFE
MLSVTSRWMWKVEDLQNRNLLLISNWICFRFFVCDLPTSVSCTFFAFKFRMWLWDISDDFLC